MNKKIYIYSLSCPIENKIKYIGKTIQKPTYRYSSHISSSKHNKKKDETHCWIKSLLNKGLLPILNIIEETNDIQREIYWIAYYKDLGYKLKNHTIGGEQGTLGATWKVDPKKLGVYKYKTAKPINQYDINGIFIKKWETALDFCKFYNIAKSCATAAIKRKGTCNGFILTYSYEKFVKPIKIFNNPIIIKNIITNEIKEFKNSIIASLEIGCNNSSLSKALKENRLLYKKYKLSLKY